MKDFQYLNQPTGRIIQQDGENYLFFGGTAYLGLLDNPRYISLYKEGIDKYGLNNGTSRNNNVQLGIYREAENHTAQRFGFEDAILLSSGYLAAQLAIKVLCGRGELIYAPDTHPALWIDGKPHVKENFDVWMEETINYINCSDGGEFVVVSNALDNLTPMLYDFSSFEAINPNKKVLFVLDDSHGIGVLRKNGTSVGLNFADRDNFTLIVVASLAKGMGTDAGVVLGNKEHMDMLRKHPIFTGASPSSPASMYVLLKGQDIYEQSFDKLQHNISLAQQLFAHLQFKSISNFSVFSALEANLYQYLLDKNVLISSFSYPFPASPLLNRIVISALHEEQDLRHIAAIFYAKS
ncbi:PLP-dependent aminotransferase family protein [Sphingobacterium pedocola]|uniref:8-amino-7-oxononanoate synthase n=1 Tax=Sphingobacterium pedocola TaxID=2082722 RepID=A0ABR9T8H5_9SPHI|nr:8-amino-7-oxononanoate synthase [Sphingobacterium pedocola]MBE8721643.1 8-amino-7-oxononanoate synthase [Sphingobacterium pedocola]